MNSSFKVRISLHGIIYLHRINDIRMHGSARRNLLLFNQLCGQDAFKKVLLVTTMWDKVAFEEGIKRENELIRTPEFWGRMLDKGSSTHRYYNAEASARDIVHRLVKHSEPVATNFLRQPPDEGRTVEQALAWRGIQREMNRQSEEWDNKFRQLAERMEDALQLERHEVEIWTFEGRDNYARKSTLTVRKVKKLQEQRSALRNGIRRVETQQKQLEPGKGRLKQQVQEARPSYPRWWVSLCGRSYFCLSPKDIAG